MEVNVVAFSWKYSDKHSIMMILRQVSASILRLAIVTSEPLRNALETRACLDERNRLSGAHLSWTQIHSTDVMTSWLAITHHNWYLWWVVYQPCGSFQRKPRRTVLGFEFESKCRQSDDYCVIVLRILTQANSGILIIMLRLGVSVCIYLTGVIPNLRLCRAQTQPKGPPEKQRYMWFEWSFDSP